MQGVITELRYTTNARSSAITVTGYDLGKLLDSCAPPWRRLRGLTWGQLTDICIDPSWRAAPTTTTLGTGITWGIQRVVGVDLNRKIKLGRAQVVIDYGVKYQQFVPPIQIEPGETAYDLLSRYGKMQAAVQKGTGSLVAVSALGDLMIFNPDDTKDDAAIWSFQYHNDSRNQRIKDAELSLKGDDLYSEYTMYSAIITRPGDPNKLDNYNPNAAKIQSTVLHPGYLKVKRRFTGTDAEQYNQRLLDARVDWKRRMSLWSEWSITYTVQGHSMPGAGPLSGRWVPLVEGQNVEIADSRNKVQGKYIVESLTRTQRPAPEGTTSRVVVRKLGLLGG
jgi:prophage tail gpP-like protein